MDSGSPEIRSYQDLRVWRESVDLEKEVYKLVKLLPSEERYALGDQLRRAVVSIPANIAEGQARQHSKEFVQFLHVARGSLAEVDTLIVVGRELSYFGEGESGSVRSRIVEIRKMLSGLIRSLYGPRSTEHGQRMPVLNLP